jgi:hypothetical protein
VRHKWERNHPPKMGKVVGGNWGKCVGKMRKHVYKHWRCAVLSIEKSEKQKM